MKTTPNPARVLRELAREAAEQPLPPIDWRRVEAGLFGHAAPVAPEGSRFARRFLPALGAMSAAAAVAALAVVGARRPVEPHAATTSARVLSAARLDGATLRPGDVVEASAAPVVVAQAGLATWTLAPGGRATVRRSGSAEVTIALDRGSVRAEVAPRAVGEAFAVEAGRTRVAVHGTAFTVTRDGERALVDLEHGTVAVGPTGHPGATTGWLLVGPERASFSLDGAEDARFLGPAALEPASAAAAEPAPSDDAAPAPSGPARPTLGPSAAPPPPAAAAARPQPPSPSPEALVARGVTELLSAIEGCRARQIAKGGVTFSVRSALTLSIAPDGSAPQARFDPPLSPTLSACAADAIARVRFPPSATGSAVQVPLSLGD